MLARADAIVDSDIYLDRLSITSSSGTLNVLSPLNTSAFAQALDSSGVLLQNSDNEVDTTAHATVTTTTVPDAEGEIICVTCFHGLPFFEFAKADVDIPNGFVGFASAEGQTTLIGSFEITGVSGSVSTDFSAAMRTFQNFFTVASGTSEVAFTLTLPDVQATPILSYANPLAASYNQNFSVSPSPALTTSLVLQANTPYSFIAALDAESFAASAPEPASLGLFATAAAGMAAMLRRRARLRS